MINRGIGALAAADEELFARAAEHRQCYFRQGYVVYTQLKRGSLHLVPRPGQLDEWRRDYQAMRSTMIFGQAPTFEEVLAVVAAFEQGYNQDVP
jgi:hypothetical protein